LLVSVLAKELKRLRWSVSKMALSHFPEDDRDLDGVRVDTFGLHVGGHELSTAVFALRISCFPTDFFLSSWIRQSSAKRPTASFHRARAELND
jgi:hypothetical protein